MAEPEKQKSSVFSLTVVVAALGYFVDIYDLQLFNLIKDKSLRGIGLTDPAELSLWGDRLFNIQMMGMLSGGLLWGIFGDKRGRKSILFGSILLYSLANIANGFATDTTSYAIIRFLAGLGLAGELGAAITLVSEVMDKEKRGWGTMIIVTVGALGAVFANLLAKELPWNYSFFVGGGLGLALLALRVGTFESTMFAKVQASTVAKGDFFSLFKTRESAIRYVCCVMVGLPVWFVIGILIKYAPVFGKATNVAGAVTTGDAIMWSYIGLSAGDLLSGAASQLWRSRRKVVMIYLVGTLLLTVGYVSVTGLSVRMFYVMAFLLGAATGYWALFVTIAAEQFGTNIRATVTTTVPNFVRGAVWPITAGYKALEATSGPVSAALVVGSVTLVLALVSIMRLRETFGRELDYVEGAEPAP